MKQWIKRLRNAVGKAIGVVAALLCFGTATALADSINLSEVTADTTVADCPLVGDSSSFCMRTAERPHGGAV